MPSASIGGRVRSLSSLGHERPLVWMESLWKKVLRSMLDTFLVEKQKIMENDRTLSFQHT